MGRISAWQIIVLVLIVLMIFGAPKLPELARSIGTSLRILKDETKKLANDDSEDAQAKGPADGDASKK